MASDRFGYCTRDGGFVPTIPALLAAGFVRRNSGVCAIAFKLAPRDAGAAPASVGASSKAIAQNPELRRTKPAASRPDMARQAICLRITQPSSRFGCCNRLVCVFFAAVIHVWPTRCGIAQLAQFGVWLGLFRLPSKTGIQRCGRSRTICLRASQTQPAGCAGPASRAQGSLASDERPPDDDGRVHEHTDEVTDDRGHDEEALPPEVRR